MEAVAAVGVASAAVQFLDFSVKTIALCKEIRDSTDGSTKANDEVAKSVKQMKGWQEDLQKNLSTTSGEARRLKETVGACMNIANELLQLLEHIREVKKKPLGTLRAALKALREGKRIEKLQTRLSDCQAKFHLALTADMRESLFDSLKAHGKNTESMRAIILQKLDFTHDRLRLLDENVTRSAAATQKGISSLGSDQQKSHASLSRGQQDLDSKITTHFSTLEVSSAHQEFLDRLYFEEMFSRQENIKDCSPGTYDWVFSDQIPHHERQLREFTQEEQKEYLELRGRILSWLRAVDRQSTFWINGKPGSGKSSLMSYLMTDKRTKENLQQWCGKRTLHLFSYFFWKPGSSLQKTVLGFRRSLLWQLCKAKPVVIDELLSQDRTLMSSPWTGTRLNKALGLASSYYRNDAVFCVLDGLDECADNHTDLLAEVLKTDFGPYTKICLSSRPEEAMRRQLIGLPSISLQEVNYGDIYEHARRKLVRSEDRTMKLAEDLAWAAEGVFLWAVLVCDSLCSGLIAEDDDETLLLRLQEYPKGLDELFNSMFASIDKFHSESLQFYFYAARQAHFSVALAVASRPAERITSLKQFGRLCEREMIRIRSQSKGLLETPSQEPLWDHAWALRGLPDGEPSERRLDDEDLRIFGQYAWSWIQFVHRSVYDYICEDVDDRLPYWVRPTRSREISGTVFQGLVWLTEYGTFFSKFDDYRFFQNDLDHALGSAISEYDFVEIDEEKICQGLGSIMDAISSWESKQASINYLDLQRAVDEGTSLASSTPPGIGLDFKKPDELQLLRGLWGTALTIEPKFVLLNFPRMWDRADTYLNVMHLLTTWAAELFNTKTRLRGRTFHTDMDSAVFAAITNMRLQGHAISSLNDFPHGKEQGHHFYSINKLRLSRTPMDFLLNSWYGVGIAHEAEIIQKLRSMAPIFDHGEEWQGRVIGIKPPGYDDRLRLRILEIIRATFGTWKLFQGPCIFDACNMLPLQLSLPIVQECFSASSTLSDSEGDCSLSVPPAASIRLSCFAHRKPRPFVPYERPGQHFKAIATYQLSTQATGVLMGFSTIGPRGFATTLFVGSPTQESRCADMVLAELWDDPNNQLTAWERLYLRACVRSYFVHFWRGKEFEWFTSFYRPLVRDISSSET